MSKPKGSVVKRDFAAEPLGWGGGLPISLGAIGKLQKLPWRSWSFCHVLLKLVLSVHPKCLPFRICVQEWF